MEQQAALLQAIGGLIAVIVWPIVVVISVLVFRDAIEGVLGRDEVSLKGPAGFAMTARRHEAAARDLIAATEARGQNRMTPQEANEGAREVDAAARELGHRPHVLWVDDRPSNNRSERAALERLGLVFELSTSTDGALGMIARRGPYDLIISDMERARSRAPATSCSIGSGPAATRPRTSSTPARGRRSTTTRRSGTAPWARPTARASWSRW